MNFLASGRVRRPRLRVLGATTRTWSTGSPRGRCRALRRGWDANDVAHWAEAAFDWIQEYVDPAVSNLEEKGDVPRFL